MSPLKRIIVGHDLREGGETALRSAALIAQRCGAALRLVHVIEPLHSYQRISHPLTAPYTIEEIAQRIGARLKTLAASQDLTQLQAEYEVRQGKPFVELIIARRAWQADLIVVGGAHEQEVHFLGSTSERVVRKAMVPVMVAKKILSARAKTFLVPTDFSDCAKKAAGKPSCWRRAFPAGSSFSMWWICIRYMRTSYGDDMEALAPLPPPSPEELESEWQAFLSGLHLGKVDSEKCTEEGQAALAIVRQADQRQVDMIVMGTHGRTGLEYMLMGSVAEKVVRAASCPVMTIKPDAFQFEMP